LLTGGWSGGWSAGNEYLPGISATKAGTSGNDTGTRATFAQLVNVTTWQTMIGMGRHRGPRGPAGQQDTGARTPPGLRQIGRAALFGARRVRQRGRVEGAMVRAKCRRFQCFTPDVKMDVK
jgi:hypothetical protein